MQPAVHFSFVFIESRTRKAQFVALSFLENVNHKVLYRQGKGERENENQTAVFVDVGIFNSCVIMSIISQPWPRCHVLIDIIIRTVKNAIGLLYFKHSTE